MSHENYVKFKFLIHKVLMEHCQAPSFRCFKCLVSLQQYNWIIAREHAVKNIYHLALYRKCLSTPNLSGNKDIMAMAKNTTKVKMNLLSRVQLFATPWTAAYQAPSSMRFSRQGYWSGLPFPSPEDLPNPGVETGSPAMQADPLPSESSGKPNVLEYHLIRVWIPV